MTQPELFTDANGVMPMIGWQLPPLPTFARTSETSRQAAIAKYDRRDSLVQRELILSFIRERGDYGATREEIQTWFKLSGDSVRPRVKELLGEAKGWTTARIRVSELTRKTASGNKAEVLVENKEGV